MSAIAPATAGPVVSFVRRRPLTSFLLWFFTVGQAFAVVPVLVDVPYPQVFIDLSTVVGLLLPALAITRIVDGPDAVRALLRSSFRWRVAPRWYVLTLVVVPALAVALALAVGGAPSGAPGAALVPGVALQLLVALVLNNWWEEVAWAGFVGVRLQERFGSTLKAALVAGPLFALQHVSLFADAGLLHAAADAAGPGSGFGPGFLARLYPDAPGIASIHVFAIALVGLAVVAATRSRLGHRADPLARSGRS